MDAETLERDLVARCLTNPVAARHVLASIPPGAFGHTYLARLWERLQAISERPTAVTRETALLAVIESPMDDGFRRWLSEEINDLYEEATTMTGIDQLASAFRRRWGAQELRGLLVDQTRRVLDGDDPYLAVRTLQARLKELTING